MRCCKSQNRKHKRDGAPGYDEHQNALVCKKHSVHDRLQRNSPNPSQMPYQLNWKERVPVWLLGWLQLAPLMELNKARVAGGRDARHGNPNKFFGALNSTGLRGLLGVAIELPESPLSFRVAIRRMGGFVSVVLAHSMQSLFYGRCSRSTGLRMEQLREFQ